MDVFTIIIISCFALFIVVLIIDSIKEGPKAIVGNPLFIQPVPPNPAFVEPCYVYTDGKETQEIRKNVAIIGYRIAPNLVLHDISGKNRTKNFEEAVKIAEKFHGTLLNEEDVETLKRNFNKINELRTKIKEPRLPEGYLWIQEKQKVALTDLVEDSPYFQVFFEIDNPCIILKR